MQKRGGSGGSAGNAAKRAKSNGAAAHGSLREVWDRKRWDAEDTAYELWKDTQPYAYDRFYHVEMDNPCFSVAWGGKAGELGGAAGGFLQEVYYSRATEGYLDANDPEGRRWYGGGNFLYKATVPMRVTRQSLRGLVFNEHGKSSHVKIVNRLVHPGQVNNMRVVPQAENLVLTHTDDPIVYLWNFAAQPYGNASRCATANVPDMMLVGHRDHRGNGGAGGDTACFYGLDVSTAAPLVLSSGSDGAVCLWDLVAQTAPDYDGFARPPESMRAVPRLDASRRMAGVHGGTTVEDVRWMPGSDKLFASVGDDRALRLWDLRLPGNSMALGVDDLHDGDINSVSWCDANPNLLATGSDDCTAKVVDVRGLGDAHAKGRYTAVSSARPEIRSYKHTAEIRVVAWRPGSQRHLATCGLPLQWKDGAQGLKVWDVDAADGKGRVVFNHIGHRAPVMSMAWNPLVDWTVVSSCSHYDHPSPSGLGTSSVQIWQPSELITRDRDAALELARGAVRATSGAGGGGGGGGGGSGDSGGGGRRRRGSGGSGGSS